MSAKTKTRSKTETKTRRAVGIVRVSRVGGREGGELRVPAGAAREDRAGLRERAEAARRPLGAGHLGRGLACQRPS